MSCPVRTPCIRGLGPRHRAARGERAQSSADTLGIDELLDDHAELGSLPLRINATVCCLSHVTMESVYQWCEHGSLTNQQHHPLTLISPPEANGTAQ